MDRRGCIPRRLASVGIYLAALPLLSACSDDATGPGGNGQFSQEITVEELGQTLASGPTHIEIELRAGTLVAREVEVEEEIRVGTRESVEAHVVDLEVNGDAGTLILDLGDLRVDFSSSAEFRDEDDDPLFMADFVAQVQAALTGGGRLRIEAEREAPGQPQAPDDGTFVATRLEIEDEDDEDGPELELDVDADNFEENASPPPDARLRVLGLAIELRVAEGLTELEAKDAASRVEFEGIVASADPDGASFTLVDGTVVRIVAATEIKQEDDDEVLVDLAAVEAALQAGGTVEAEGDGIVVSQSPRTMEAIEVEFELEDDD